MILLRLVMLLGELAWELLVDAWELLADPSAHKEAVMWILLGVGLIGLALLVYALVIVGLGAAITCSRGAR